MDTISGTTSSENARVMGAILTASGDAATNTIVKIIPSNHNPFINSIIEDTCIDTTDSKGNYHFSLSEYGTFNIEAYHRTHGTKFLVSDISVDEDTVLVPTGSLKETGALRVFLPDSVDTASGYVYIEGTSLLSELGNGIYYTGDKYAVIINSIPFGKVPPIRFSATSSMSIPSIVLTDTVTIQLADTVNIGIDTTEKQIWHFPIIVGVTSKTVENLPYGFVEIKTLIYSQINLCNNYFNDSNVFDGVINFKIDSIYEFSTPVEQELKVPIGPYALRMIYDGYSIPHESYWRPSNRVLYIPKKIENGDDFFSEKSTRSIVWGLGLTRGCPGQYNLRVDSTKNNINGKPYRGLESIMNYPSKYVSWDTYSINIINHYENQYSIFPEIIKDALPSLGAKARNSGGVPLPYVSIELFGVEWGSKTVTDTSLISGTTDSLGIVKFPTNPFRMGDINNYELVYSNFLIRAIDSMSDTTFAWMPITEVGNAWFANSDTLYLKDIIFECIFF